MKKLAIALLLLFAVLWGIRTLGRSRTFQLFGEIVHRVETDRKVVALTFDDGPRAQTLDEILEPLRKRNVKATFFVIGAEVRENPQAISRLVTAGHEIGNHSYSHPRLWFMRLRTIQDQFDATDAAIRGAGYHGPIHIRAPYCKKLLAMPWYCRVNRRIHVTFDVEPETFPEVDASAAAIEAHVLEHVKPGSIVLLHPWYPGREQTRAALPKIIDGLRDRGYELVTVDELLKLRKT